MGIEIELIHLNNLDTCFECQYLKQVKTLMETNPQYICVHPDIDILQAKQNEYKGCQSYKSSTIKHSFDFNKFVPMDIYFKLLTMKNNPLPKPTNLIIPYNSTTIL